MPNVVLTHVVFWKGCGLIPCLIRLMTRRRGQDWDKVPSHCAILIPDDTGCLEYEAIVTGIRKTTFGDYVDVLCTQGVIDWCSCDIVNMNEMKEWLDGQVGKPYGYLAVATTGLGIISPSSWDRSYKRIWEHLAGGKSGRTAPLDCSLLCRMALTIGGFPVSGREDGLPVSPNDLYNALKVNQNETN